MTDQEFERAVETLKRMIATLEIGVDVVVDGREDGVDARHGAESAIADLTKRVRSALDSIGFDVDEWLEDELEDVIPGTEAAKAIEAVVEAAEDVAKGEDGREVRDRIWGDYTAERSRMKIEEDER